MIKSVTVFCASTPRGERGQEFLDLAYAFGKALGTRGLVCVNGGTWGMMTALSRGAHEVGGEVHCVLLDQWEIDHQSYTRLENFSTLSQRQQRLITLGDAYVALPGGVGTHFEIFEVLVGKAVGIIPRERPLVCVGSFYKPFREYLEHLVAQGVAGADTFELISFVETIEDAFPHFAI